MYKSWIQLRWQEQLELGIFHIGRFIPYGYFQPGMAFRRLAFRAQRMYYQLNRSK